MTKTTQEKNRSLLLSIFIFLALGLTSCNLPLQGGSNPGVTETPVLLRDLSGTWTGPLTENGGYLRHIDLVIFHAEGASELTGNITITNMDGSIVEYYDIIGTFDGSLIRFATTQGLNFWGTVSAGTMSGAAAVGCDDCPDQTFGQFNLTYGIIGTTGPGEVGSSSQIRDLSGTWTGPLTENGGYLRHIDLVIFHGEGVSELTGNITITNMDGSIVEYYDITGTFNGSLIRFATTNGLNFWGTVSGSTMSGAAAVGCYDCPDQTFGQFNLTYGITSATPAGMTVSPMPSALDPSGIWNGTLLVSTGHEGDLNMVLEITLEPGTNDFSGTLNLTLPASEYQEFYLVGGTISGNYIQFHDSGTEVITHYFWGTVTDISMEGFASLTCYDCPDQAYAVFRINR